LLLFFYEKFSTIYELNKALEKTLFHFFSGWLCVWQKNESVFCAVEWVGFFYKFIFEALALEAVSVAVQVIPKMFVQSTKVSS